MMRRPGCDYAIKERFLQNGLFYRNTTHTEAHTPTPNTGRIRYVETERRVDI